MSQSFDAIVVGSGASGSFAAKELTERGLRVALIEAGPPITPADFADPPRGPVEKGVQLKARAIAALTGQPRQAKVPMYGAQFRHLFVKDREHPYATTRQNPYLWLRGKQLGGRLHTYGRVLMRWSDTDFRAGERDARSPNWPIRYADIAPWYDRVEDFLGVVGTQDGIPNLPDGHYLKPSHLTGLERRLKDAVAARWPDRHVVPWRYMPPNARRVPQPILAAQATGLLTVFTDTIARRVLTDDAGKRATGVEVVNAKTREVSVIAGGVVMLCASPVETIRLMLNSASATAPNGLGNSSGILGRYFMDQAAMLIFGTAPDTFGKEDDPTWPADPWYGKTGGAYIPRWQNLGDARADFARGYGFQGTGGRLHVNPGRNAQVAFMGFCELLPDADNRVTLDRRRDRWGMPIPHIRCWLGENERRLLADAAVQAKAMFDAVGFETEWIGSPLGLQEFGRGAYPNESRLARAVFRLMFRRTMTLGAAIHESGGARMGDDPAQSVLNAHNQSWDVPNLFVTDASAFPTSGTAGTTLTIMALTMRAAAYAATELGAGRL